MEQKSSRVVKWSLVLGIVIVLNLFFNYSLSVVYKAPQYNNFCPIQQVPQPIATQAQCLNVGGQWSQNGVISTAPGALEKNAPQMSFYCNPDYTCNINYQAAQNTYDRNVFITLVALGVLIVLLSFALKNNEVLSASFSLGGVLSFIVASVRYWSSANDLIKMVILGIALAILIYLAYRKFSVHTSHESKI